MAVAAALGLGLGLFLGFRAFIAVAVLTSAALAILHGAGLSGGSFFAIIEFVLLQLGYGLGLGLRAVTMSRWPVRPSRQAADFPPAAGRQER